MVDFVHLPTGNPDNSPSRDLVADFGIAPISPKMTGTDLVMVESDPAPLNVSISSDESSNSEMNDYLELGMSTEVQGIFRAALHLSKQDRLDAVEERKKNQNLMDFFAAHGYSTKQLNDFASKGKVQRKVNDLNMFEKSSLTDSEKTCGMVSGDDSSKNESAKINSTFEIGCSSSGHLENVEIHLCSKRDGDANLVQTKGAPITSGPPPMKSWSSIVANDEQKPCIKLEYLPPPPADSANGPIIIRPPIEVLKEGNKLWNSCLVGGFLNSRLPFKFVEETVHKLWDKYGLKKVFLQDKGYFVFKFSKPEERENVLALGPWYISNKLLILKHWKEGIDFQDESCKKAPIWVKFYHVPYSYWSAKGLSFLASAIGKPLLVDKITEKMEPTSFARICIEITPNSEMPTSLKVAIIDEETDSEKIVVVEVEYQNRPQLCMHCNSFGHSTIKCPRTNYKWVPKGARKESDVVIHSVNEGQMEQTSSKEDRPVDLTDCPITSNPDDQWTTVTKGTKKMSSTPLGGNLVEIPGSLSNSFAPISLCVDLGDLTNSDVDSVPRPIPLIDKIKTIDEREGRDLKSKARSSLDQSQKSKKKSKKGGGVSKTPN